MSAPKPSRDPGPADPATPLATERSTSMPLSGLALGIDVGGTGVKAAIVDLATAELVTSRVREKTPQPSTPEAVLETIASVVEKVLAERADISDLPVGCGLPGAIKGGVMKTAANLDKSWIDFEARTRISERLGRPVHVINDADAAGMAELAYGEARGRPGTVILLTVGTGIGSALISDGRLVPNTELGHLIMRRKASETLVGGAARERRKLGWKAWAREFNQYLAMVEFFFWPDRIILGGGVSKESQRYWSYLSTKAELVKARFLNTSGIIGAAYAAGLLRHGSGAHATGVDTAATPDRMGVAAGSGTADVATAPGSSAVEGAVAKPARRAASRPGGRRRATKTA